MQNIKIFAFSDEVGANIDKQINALMRNNLNGMEIRNVDGTNISDIMADKAKEVLKKLEDKGLRVWSIGSPIGKININDPFEGHLEKFKHTLEIAEILKAEKIRLFSFYMPVGETPENYKEKVLNRLNSFVSVAKDYNITLCHENEKGIFGDIPERCAIIHKALPEIKAVFDPANFVQCNVNTLDAWETLKEYVDYMHIKDADNDGIIVPAGKGVGNIRQLAEDYLSRGGNTFTMEPHLFDFDGLKNLEQANEATKIGGAFADADEAFDTACNSFKNILRGE